MPESDQPTIFKMINETSEGRAAAYEQVTKHINLQSLQFRHAC